MNQTERGYEVIKRIKSIKEAMHSSMEKQFKELQLTAPQGMVVGTLFRFGSQSISELSAKMGLSLSTISGIIDRLEKNDIVKRSKSKDDGRVVVVELTEKFKKESSKTFQLMDSTLGEKLNKASEEDIAIVLKALDVLDALLFQSDDTKNDTEIGE